ncbi:LLM class F420-dependent oxidoreductase [Propionibacteriaceae bacterium Y1700]|uniref:LLM class F420-dependent oxidoreductase n=1 Tax=Microlunatus sp. Y1700 TaxID=3418487 RepID=UPI003DA72FBE
MKLGLNLGYMVGADDPQGQLALTRRAEEQGYDSVWAAEAYGSDSPTVLAWLAGQTSTIGIGSAVMQIPARTPAMTAMTAASMDLLTAGRFRLGLGVSGPQVSEGWHGVRFAQPLGRTREYVEIVRTALSRKTLVHEGKHWTLPLPDGPGKPIKLTIAPHGERIPILIAAVGPKNLELAGEIADGWLGVFVTPEFAGEQIEHIRAGRAKVDKDLSDFDVMASVPVVVGDDPQRCADPVRSYAALYLGGMGSRDKNFYNQLAVRMGYGDAAAQVQDLFLAQQHRDAMAAVPYEFIDATSLLGDTARIAGRLTRLAEAGVTTCAIVPYGRTLDEKLIMVDTVAEAYRQASLDS